MRRLKTLSRWIFVGGVSIATAAGAHGGDAGSKPVVINSDPFPSSYRPLPSQTVLITHASIMTGTGTRIDDGSVLLKDGKIVAIGAHIDAPGDATVIDASGKWVTPGLIDVHSHLGVGFGGAPSVSGQMDANESTDPNTANVWVEHSVWPQDPGFSRALAAGVTTMQILPGSANLFGGRAVVLKNVPSTTVQGMKFPGAPYGLKMACGENPKRVYGQKQHRAPGTRMGNFAGYRTGWIKATEYKRKWDKYRAEVARGKTPEPPERDLQLETLAGVLSGEILVQMHCYQAHEMVQVIDMSREFGYKIAAFHHAPEAYKIADILAKNHICAAIWADRWGFKMEAYDGIRENLPMVEAAGGCAIVHSDSPIDIQRLTLIAEQARADGQRAGINITPEQAMRWVTLNAATALGIADKTGSLEPGKNADVVIWTGSPFSVYSHPEKVFVDGALLYDRNDPSRQPVSDFELGQQPQGGVQ